MRTNILLLLLWLTSWFAVAGDYVIVCNPPGETVKSGQCVLYNGTNDSIGIADINSIGHVLLPAFGYTAVEIKADGCSSILMSFSQIANLKSDTIFVKPYVELSEVIVTPDNVKDLGNRMSYRIPMADMDRYSNFYQALNEIPHLTILPTGGAYYQGGDKIQFLLNGVATTTAELQTISKEDINNVEVYRNPPAKYIAQGIETVIDVRTKSNLTGGNFGLNVDQAFYPVMGNNNAALYYNYRRSRFSVIYTGFIQHLNKYQQNEKLEYEFDGVEYLKLKTGEDSPWHKDNHGVAFSFQNNKPDDYIYNLEVGCGWNQEKRNAKQNVVSDNYEFDAVNFLKTRYNRYTVANYFEKHLGKQDKYGSINATLSYQHFDSRYNSSYQEFPVDEAQDIVNNSSAYKTRLDGVFASVSYSFPRTKVGYFSITALDSYDYSQYADSDTPFFQKTNTFTGGASWFGFWKKIQWSASMQIRAEYELTTMLDKPYTTVVPSPDLQLRWRPNQSFSLTANYSYSSNLPSIAELSETDQWLDTKLVYHGNARLVASKSHNITLTPVYNNRYFAGSIDLIYVSNPDMICSQYMLTENYMLETIVNLDSYREFAARLNFNIMPLGNNKLMFWNRINYADVRGKNPQYSWHGTRFQWMSMLALNLTKWSFYAFYQYPGKVIVGQTVRPRGQAWYVSASYRPIRDLSIGLKWFMPFGKQFKDSEYTIKGAPVFHETSSICKDYANYVSLQLSWNISFGRNQNRVKANYYKGKDDAGILTK